MLLQIGSKGTNVSQLQTFLKITADGSFGPNTQKAVMQWQQQNGLTADGVVGPQTLAKMQAAGLPAQAQTSGGVIVQGSTVPGQTYSSNLKVTLNPDMVQTYLPALDQALPDDPKGLKLLVTIMAFNEGFLKTSKSYRTNNPGNIGNTDGGGTQTFPTLVAGIQAQKSYVQKVVSGGNRAYPMNKQVNIAPYYSPEIANNPKTYGNMSPYLPGYSFVFTGQLDQYVKIYSTGARGGNSYINRILSYFNANGLQIKPESKIQDIIVLK